MGYSCTAAASNRFELIMSASRDTASNTWFNEKGVRYMSERGREQADGAITMAVMKFVGENSVVRAGGIRIEPDGTVTRFPGMNKDMRRLSKLSASEAHAAFYDYTRTQRRRAVV